MCIFCIKINTGAKRWWLTPADFGRIMVHGQLGQIVHEITLHLQNDQSKMDWRCGLSSRGSIWQAQSLEFKLQAHQNKQKKIVTCTYTDTQTSTCMELFRVLHKQGHRERYMSTNIYTSCHPLVFIGHPQSTSHTPTEKEPPTVTHTQKLELPQMIPWRLGSRGDCQTKDGELFSVDGQ
jgi:hypothetical protein